MLITYECPTCERPVEILTEQIDGGDDVDRFGGTLSCPCGDNFDMAFDIERDANGIVEEIELMRCTPSAPAIQDFTGPVPTHHPDPNADWHGPSETQMERRSLRPW
jgi:hypothetical protein